MAEIAVSLAVKMLAQVIGGAVLDEIKHLRGVSDDVKWLHEELKWMKCFLLDAEQRSLSGDEIAKMWVRKVTDTAYRAEDVAATLAARRFTIGDGAEDVAATSDSRSTGFWSSLRNYGSCCCITSTGFWSFVLNFGSVSWITSTGDGVGSPASRRYVPSVSDFKQLHEIGNDLKELKKEIKEIGKRRERYGFINSNAESSSREDLIRKMRRKPLFQNKEDVFGLENEKRKVMDLLHSDKSGNYVIGIVGMGGMGKTTLARQVFNSIDRSQFPKLAWVDLSQNYIQNHSIDKLLIEIAKQVIPKFSGSESMRTEDLSKLLKSNLKGERYLIIMDDMWETDVWDLVKDHLPHRKNGNRIIITTRKEDVAEHPALHFPPHRMEGLDNVQSWKLFTHLVFEDAEPECTGELKELAEELVRGCGGSPLALTVLGGLLAGKQKTLSAWRKVLGNRNWLRREAGKNCLDILRLSYMDLPHHLKMCFLYLSAFPEDHKIGVDKLIRLWVAEGFAVKTDSNGEETVEDIARTYLDDLKQMCLVMVHEEFIHDGSYLFIECHEYCRIHDLIRELSINEAKKANFMNSEMTDSRNEVMHRLSLHGEFSSDNFEGIGLSSLRTLLSFTEVPIAFKKFYLLRVLDLEGSCIDELPEEVGDMVLLRYLSIKGTQCKSLPDSISRLSYLETLDCRTLISTEVPNDVCKIKTLKHVYGECPLDGIDVSNLIKLQTLRTLFPVAIESMSYSIQHMTNLQDLSIGWGNMTHTDITIWKSLQKLPSLKFLHVQWLPMDDTVIERTGFPSLQRLTMTSCGITSWKVEKGSMPSLEILILESCHGLKRLPPDLVHCKKLRGIYCYSMYDEFKEWYNRSKKEAAWEFQHVHFICQSADLIGLSSYMATSTTSHPPSTFSMNIGVDISDV